MSNNLKKVLIAGAALLMFVSVGVSTDGVNVSARHVSTNKVTNVNHKFEKTNKRNIKNNSKITKRNNHKSRRNKRAHNLNGGRQGRNTNRHYRKHNVKRLNKKQLKVLVKKAHRKSHRNKKAKHNNTILKSHYRRSNNKRLLKISGFVNLNSVLPDTPGVQSKYAPNDHRAVIPRRLNVNGDLWLQARLPQLHPMLYQYVSVRHGWVKLGNL